MKRIAIIGNAGTGKSYLAGRLAERHDVPVVALDDLFWLRPGDYATKRPADQLAILLASERGKQAWVVEGVYGELIHEFLSAAEQLIWLDIPWATSVARLTAREGRRGRSTDDASFQALLTYAAAYWQRTDGRSHSGHGRLFDEFRHDKHRFTSEDAVNAFLQQPQHPC